jgi:hypothetical protein
MVYGGTAYNRTVYASPPVGGSGYVLARSLRYAPFPRKTSATFLQPWSLLRKALIRAAKTSQTAGTLCEIFSGIYSKIYRIFVTIHTISLDINLVIGYKEPKEVKGLLQGRK